MASHKSPSSQRWLDRCDGRDILATRRARAQERKLGLTTPEYSDVPGHGYESAGHYHWRLLHKNLSKPILRTRRLKIVTVHGDY